MLQIEKAKHADHLNDARGETRDDGRRTMKNEQRQISSGDVADKNPWTSPFHPLSGCFFTILIISLASVRHDTIPVPYCRYLLS